MESHTQKNMRNTFWLKHHEVWEAVTDVLDEHIAFIWKDGITLKLESPSSLQELVTI